MITVSLSSVLEYFSCLEFSSNLLSFNQDICKLNVCMYVCEYNYIAQLFVWLILLFFVVNSVSWMTFHQKLIQFCA